MHRGRNNEKAKDFSGALKRLFVELKDFRVLIFISLILAMLGSILSIVAPNKVSDMTDEISKGLVVNTKNLKKLSTSIQGNLSQDKISQKLPEILEPQMNDLSMDDLAKLKNNDYAHLSDDSLNKIFKDSTYNGVKIPAKDKIAFVKNQKMSKSILEAILPEITIDGVKISPKDQAVVVTEFGKMSKNTKTEKIYKKLDKMPKSVKKVINPKMNMTKIRNIFFLLLGMYLLSALFTLINQRTMTDVANKFAKRLRNDISVKINKLPLKYFDKHQKGDTLSRVTNDVDMISQTMNQSLASLVASTTLFLGSLIMMFVTNATMALTAVGASVIGFIFVIFILLRSQKYFNERQVELGNLNGHIEEVYSGLTVVKAYNGKEEVDKKFDELNNRLYNANYKSQFLSGLMQPFMGFIGNLGYVAVCIVGAMLAMNGKISFGVIVAFITYVRLFTSPLSQIAQGLTQLQSAAAASERVFEFLDEEEMPDESKLTKKLTNAKGLIEFDHVSFRYDGNDHDTIKDFSAIAKPGQKVAIVGPTGAGKTTMVNLLMKFYDVTKGDIKIDGISTKELTRENIHDLFIMVLQDTWLFEGTVKDNVRYNSKASDEDIERVCKVVGLDHFIRTLPKGYDSELSDNDSVSSGQRQLLTIARGMIKDAPFLILDEATSNVDTRTEELVQKAMDKLTEGRTSFIIAHRLSTIKNADLILVMKDGNIIEQGNHEELMKKNGFYADLYNSQFEL